MKNIDELKKQLENDNALILRYRVQEEIYHKKANAINFETMKMALNEVGIYLDIKDGELVLSLHKYKYLRRKTRNAGTKRSALVEQMEVHINILIYFQCNKP